MPQDTSPLAVAEGVTTRLLAGPDDAADAIDLLDRAEAAAGVPLVDESERQRLLAAVGDEQAVHHHAVLARTGRGSGDAGAAAGNRPDP